MDPEIIYSRRKSIALTVNNTGKVLVRAPKGTCIVDLKKFVLKHQDWIIKQQQKVNQNSMKLLELEYDPEKCDEYKIRALNQFEHFAEEYAHKIKVKYKKLRLSNAHKKWGSCNSKKTVSINWRLVFVPSNLQEYVILHELAHLKEMNHSKRFWKVIEAQMPDYKERKKQLKEYDYLMMLD